MVVCNHQYNAENLKKVNPRSSWNWAWPSSAPAWFNFFWFLLIFWFYLSFYFFWSFMIIAYCINGQWKYDKKKDNICQVTWFPFWGHLSLVFILEVVFIAMPCNLKCQERYTDRYTETLYNQGCTPCSPGKTIRFQKQCRILMHLS